MKERYAAALGRLVEEVDGALGAPLSLDSLAARAGISKYHLHHVFRLLTGLPLMEYVRRRRLSASIDALLESDRSVIDIALDHGFGYEQSYIRAFQRSFGVSPGRYRALRTPLPITERVDVSRLRPFGDDGVLLEPRLILKPAAVICGIRSKVDLAENEKENVVTRLANDFFYRARRAIAEPYHEERFVGVVFYSGDPTYNWYLAGAELREPPRSGPPEGMEYFELPKRRCMEFVHVSRVHPNRIAWNDLRRIYAYIFGKWIPEQMGRPAEGWHLEYVETTTARPDYGEFRILIPLAEQPATGYIRNIPIPGRS